MQKSKKVPFGADITGQRFNRLVAVRFIERRATGNTYNYYWLFKCDCGNNVISPYYGIRNGKVKSCGCYQKEVCTTHGRYIGVPNRFSKDYNKFSQLYVVMTQGCYDKNNSRYPFYGGRGIKSEWTSFKEFKKDMKASYERHRKKHKTTCLGRKDFTENFSKNNCEWFTRKERLRNNIRTRYVTYKGQKISVAEFVERTKRPKSLIISRLNGGWEEDELLKPKGYRARRTRRTDFKKADYMHNKFIVVDNRTVWTGSMNPTPNGVYYNNNNVIVINSTELACDYATELLEMWNGQFGKSSPADTTPYPIVYVDGTEIECYFAPEDGVEVQIVDELNKGHSSVYFATFSFTSQPIAQTLIDLDNKGVEMKGIYEKRQDSTWCTYKMLDEAGIDVIWDENPKTMHHKFFIIDNTTTITGSYNPTKHANTANDENILIIHNDNISNEYVNEFFEMWNEWR